MVGLVQVMFEGKKHSKIVIKSIWIFSIIFQNATRDQAKYLQGSLYTIGALLKMEARSYLSSTGRRNLIEQDCNQEEERHFEVKIRDLNQREIEYFENEFHHALCSFIDSLLGVKDIQKAVTIENMKLHWDLIQEDFLEEYDKYNKKDHEGLMRTEAANFALLFMLDLLQFFYQFLSKTKQKPLEDGAYKSQDIADYGKMHKTVPNYLNHTFDYTVNDSVILVRQILKAIKVISPNPSHMLELWHLRRHIEIKTGITTADEVREDQSYERTDKFNTLGLLMYVYWCLKARINSTVDEEYRHSRFEELEGFESPLPEIVTREFEFEILFPVLAIASKENITYPHIMDVVMEILSYYCKVVNPESLSFPGWRVSAAGNSSENYKLLLQSIFEYIGSSDCNYEKKAVYLEIFKKLINIYSAFNIEDIMFDVIVESKNDKEKALLVDLYKHIILKANQEEDGQTSVISQFKDHLKLMFDYHLNVEKE